MAELAHAWLLGHPEVCSVISGAPQVTQVEQNAASAAWHLNAKEMAEIEDVIALGG